MKPAIPTLLEMIASPLPQSPLASLYLMGYSLFMARFFESNMQDLNKAVCQEQGKTAARKTKPAVKPVTEFDTGEIRGIRPQQAGRRITTAAGNCTD
jgi:hypothetical protein